MFSHGVHEGYLPEQVWQFDPIYMQMLLASPNVSAEDKATIEASHPGGGLGKHREFEMVLVDGVYKAVAAAEVSNAIPIGETVASLAEKWRLNRSDDLAVEKYMGGS